MVRRETRKKPIALLSFRKIVFLHRCLLKGEQRFFIEKKASFRLSVEVNLDNLLTITRIFGNQAYQLCVYCQSVGLVLQYLVIRESRPYFVDAVGLKLHFLCVCDGEFCEFSEKTTKNDKKTMKER